MKYLINIRLLTLILFLSGLSTIASAAPLERTEAVPLIPPLPVVPPVIDILSIAKIQLHGPDLVGKDGPLHKLTFDLIVLSTEYQVFLEELGIDESITSFMPSLSPLTVIEIDGEKYILIDAIANGDAETLLADLEVLGLTDGAAFYPIVSGFLPLSQLDEMADLATLRFVHASVPATHSGAIVSQGDVAMESDQVRKQFNLSGDGITVGLLSDSYDCLGDAEADQKNNELPADVNLIAEGKCQLGRDEGRAMGQIIHDIAPGSSQAFYTAFNGQAAFAHGILTLADEGDADIIVDDVIYFGEPMFQDGVIAQAIDQVYADGTVYLSSAGNYGRQSYEAPFRNTGSTFDVVDVGVLHDFDPGSDVDPFQQITIPPGSTATIILNWDQPYASATGKDGSASDLDLILLSSSLTQVAVSIDKNIGNDPIEVLRYTNTGTESTFNLVIVKVLGTSPDLMKYVYTGSDVTVDEYDTSSSTLFGHANVQEALTVGASFFYYSPAFSDIQPQPRPYSARGPTPILFDQNDDPVMQLRAKPDMLAPDGGNTTFFGKDLRIDSDDHPNFTGTSASAPHAAGVVALLLESDRTLNPEQVYQQMTQTSFDVVLNNDDDTRGFDYESGHGFIQALTLLESTVEHDLDVSVIATNDTIQPGKAAEYIYRFVNTGPQTARDLQLRMTYPNELINTTITKMLDEGVTGTLTGDGNNVELSIPVLRVNQSGTVIVGGILNPKLNGDVNLNGEISAISDSDIEQENNQAIAKIAMQVPQLQFANRQIREDELEVTLTLNRANPNADAIVDVVEYRNPETKNSVLVKQTVTIMAGDSSILINWPSFALGQRTTDSYRTLFLENPIGAAVGQQQSAVIVPDGVDVSPTPDAPEVDPTVEDPTVEDPTEDDPTEDNPDISPRDNDGDSIPDNQNLGDSSNNNSLLPAIHLPLIEQ